MLFTLLCRRLFLWVKIWKYSKSTKVDYLKIWNISKNLKVSFCMYCMYCTVLHVHGKWLIKLWTILNNVEQFSYANTLKHICTVQHMQIPKGLHFFTTWTIGPGTLVPGVFPCAIIAIKREQVLKYLSIIKRFNVSFYRQRHKIRETQILCLWR